MYGLGVTAEISTTTVIPTSTSPAWGRIVCSATRRREVFGVTARAGVGDPGFSTSAAWFDYDSDGRLDLFVGITYSGRSRPIARARWTAATSPIARQNRTRARARLSTATRGTARSRTSHGRPACTTRQTRHGGRPHRLRQRRRAGSVRGQRHAAESSLPEQEGRHVRRRRDDGGVAFNEAGVARAGMGVDAGTTTPRAARVSSSATSPTR